jgi:hypothetical protein
LYRWPVGPKRLKMSRFVVSGKRHLGHGSRYTPQILARSVLNDLPLPCLMECLHTLAVAQDRAYLSLPATSRATMGFHIDWEVFIERYFWDTDVLMVAEIWSRLSAEAKQHLGLRDALCGVIHGLAPHPDEVVLQRVEDGEVS